MSIFVYSFLFLAGLTHFTPPPLFSILLCMYVSGLLIALIICAVIFVGVYQSLKIIARLYLKETLLFLKILVEM